MELVAAVVSASLLLGETLAPRELVGGLLVLATVVAETLREVVTPQISPGQP
jgi:drug/metabolite transporter (DMT)-like permease